MGYRISYHTHRRQERSVWDAVRLQCVLAGAMFLAALAVKVIWPGGEKALAKVFEPGEQAAMVAAAQVLKDGGSLREGLVALCRGVLTEAGYAP